MRDAPPDPSPPRGLNRFCCCLGVLGALALCWAASVLAYYTQIIPDEPAWRSDPVLLSFLEGEALDGYQPPIPPGLRVGQRWVFETEHGGQVCWTIAAIDSDVHYREERTPAPTPTPPPALGTTPPPLVPPTPAPATGPHRWRYAAPSPVQEVQLQGREILQIDAQRFDCLHLRVQEWRSMMNDVRGTLWIATQDGLPVFPGIVRWRRTNQGHPWTAWELIEVAEPGVDAPGGDD